MSRVYRVRVSGSEERIIHVADGVESRLQLLPVLARERMAELLGAELVDRGFELEGKLARRREGELTLEVDVESGTVAVRIEAERHIKTQGEEVLHSTKPIDEKREVSAQKKLRGRLEQELDEQAEQRQDEVTRALEQQLRDIRVELDQAVNGATRTALKEKAAQLGQVLEAVEDESGSLTIRVKL